MVALDAVIWVRVSEVGVKPPYIHGMPACCHLGLGQLWTGVKCRHACCAE